MSDCIQGVLMTCQNCGKLTYRRILDTDAVFIEGQMILPDRWICDECIPAVAEKVLREFQDERDGKRVKEEASE